MGYTLLNPSAVGFDVVRRPAAQRVASVLLVAATATPSLLEELARRHPLAGLAVGDRQEALAESTLQRQVHAASYLVTAPRDGGVDGPTALHEGAPGPISSELGGAHDVDAYISEELLGLPTVPGAGSVVDAGDTRRLASDMLAQAAVAAWTARAEDPADDTYRIIKQVAAAAGRPAGLGPNAARVLALLDGLPAGAGQWAAFRVGLQRAADPVDWAQAMQEAAWAAWLSAREHAAVAAQMLAVIALADRGMNAGGDTARLWDLVSGMVAAAVVEDVLHDAAASVLSGGVPA